MSIEINFSDSKSVPYIMKKELVGLYAGGDFLNKPITFSHHSIIINWSIHELKAEIAFHPKEKEIILDWYQNTLFMGEFSDDEEQTIIWMELTSLNRHVKSRNKWTKEELELLIGEDWCVITIYYEPYVRENDVQENEMSYMSALGGLYHIVDCYWWVGDRKLKDSFDESIPYEGDIVPNYQDEGIGDYFKETIKTLHTMPKEKWIKWKLEEKWIFTRIELSDDEY